MLGGLTEFVSVMQSKGLVFLDDGETQVYIDFQEGYS